MVKEFPGIVAFKRGLPYGWTKLYRFYEKDTYLICAWWAYPFLRPFYAIKERDWTLKRLVYTLGFLDTPEMIRFEWKHFSLKGSAARRRRNIDAWQMAKACRTLLTNS